ncbi:MAG TPA: proteasome subunit alpha [Verrucomicrobiae bacterium]|jgi:proteasome beta subunit|nr:proteasome subunit alpha [Verrucomicrobiae bacterium]
MSGASSIAGDFLGLLAERKLASAHVAAHDGAPVQTQATTVFAFHCAEGVLMAGDRRATAGNIIVTDRVEKIIEIDPTSLLAIAGVPATAFEMARVLQTSFEYYRRSQLQPLSLPARVRALARLLRENLPMTMQGIGIVVPLFAGVDHAATPPQPQIYFYDPLGAQFQAVGYATSGSGSGTIRSILSYQERYGKPRPEEMDLREAVRFASRLLATASEFDSATGGVNPATNTFATLKLLRSTGVETITDSQQKEFLRE